MVLRVGKACHRQLLSGRSCAAPAVPPGPAAARPPRCTCWPPPPPCCSSPPPPSPPPPPPSPPPPPRPPRKMEGHQDCQPGCGTELNACIATAPSCRPCLTHAALQARRPPRPRPRCQPSKLPDAAFLCISCFGRLHATAVPIIHCTKSRLSLFLLQCARQPPSLHDADAW